MAFARLLKLTVDKIVIPAAKSMAMVFIINKTLTVKVKIVQKKANKQMFCQTAARRPALESRRRPLTVRLFGERAIYAKKAGTCVSAFLLLK